MQENNQAQSVNVNGNSTRKASLKSQENEFQVDI